MQQLFEAILRLDDANDVGGVESLLASHRYDEDQIFSVFLQLIDTFRKHHFLRPAYILANHLNQAGRKHPCISLVLSMVGLILDAPQLESSAFTQLQAQMSAMSVTEQLAFGEKYSPPMRGVMYKYLILNPDDGKNRAAALRLIEILKTVAPQFQPIFDWNAPISELSIDEMRQRGREQACLIPTSLPPSNAVRVPHRVLLMFDRSYPFGFGFRYKAAMESYGWQAEMCDDRQYNTAPGHPWYRFMQDVNAAIDCRNIVQECRQKNIDLLFFDVSTFIKFKNGFAEYKEMKAQLLLDNPSLKIFGLLLDVYTDIDQTVLDLIDALFDGILSAFPTESHIQDSPNSAALRKKLLQFSHIPVGEQNLGIPNKPLIPTATYRGRLDAYHWVRAVWLFLAVKHSGLPIHVESNKFSFDDPLFKKSPLDDFSAYMRSVAESTCSLGMVIVNRDTVQSGFTRYLSSKSFEAPLSGALLVQEFSPLMHQFFIPGEHYLEFSSLAELSAVMRFISEHREEAEEIRRRGNAFARERYSDTAIVGHIDRFLYFSE